MPSCHLLGFSLLEYGRGIGSGAGCALAGDESAASADVVGGENAARFPGSTARDEMNASLPGDFSSMREASVAGNCNETKDGAATTSFDSESSGMRETAVSCACANPHAR